MTTNDCVSLSIIDKKTKSSPGEEHTSPEAGNTETGSVKCIGSSEEVLSGEDIASLAVNLETFRRVGTGA